MASFNNLTPAALAGLSVAPRGDRRRAWGLRVQKVRAAAGLPSTVKLHHLRHTLSTLLDECGATETLKAGILGHAKATQTQKYTHARLAAMRTVLQAVEDRVLSAFDSNIESNDRQAVS